MRHLFTAGFLLLAVTASAQTIQRGEITLNANGDVIRFGAGMQMVDATPLDSRGGLRRYIAKQPTEGSFEHKYVCALVLTVEGSRGATVTTARALGISNREIPMYSVSRECFSFNGAEVDFHVSDFNIDGWDLGYSSGTGQDQTGQFRPDDPDRDVAAFNYIVPLFRKMSGDYQRAHPDAPDNVTLYKVGGDVSAPVLTHAVDAEFSQDARSNHISGVSVVKLVVNTQGLPEHISVVGKLGHGLDEKAVEAVRQYRFTPSLYHGQPVPVEVTIRVNFHVN